jgi:hypothetical protein
VFAVKALIAVNPIFSSHWEHALIAQNLPLLFFMWSRILRKFCRWSRKDSLFFHLQVLGARYHWGWGRGEWGLRIFHKSAKWVHIWPMLLIPYRLGTMMCEFSQTPPEHKKPTVPENARVLRVLFAPEPAASMKAVIASTGVFSFNGCIRWNWVRTWFCAVAGTAWRLLLRICKADIDIFITEFQPCEMRQILHHSYPMCQSDGFNGWLRRSDLLQYIESGSSRLEETMFETGFSRVFIMEASKAYHIYSSYSNTRHLYPKSIYHTLQQIPCKNAPPCRWNQIKSNSSPMQLLFNHPDIDSSTSWSKRLHQSCTYYQYTNRQQ